MPALETLYPILICPNTHGKLIRLDNASLESLNQAIKSGCVFNLDNQKIDVPLTDGLMTEDGKYVYRIDNGLPILLPGEAIIHSDQKI